MAEGPAGACLSQGLCRGERRRPADPLQHRRFGHGAARRRREGLVARLRGRRRRTQRGFRFHRHMHGAVLRQEHPDPSGPGRLHRSRRHSHPFVRIHRSVDGPGQESGGSRLLEVGDRHRGERGQVGRSGGDGRLSRIRVARPLFRRRPDQLQAHPLHPGTGKHVPRLGPLRHLALQPHDRQALRVGALARSGKPADNPAQAQENRLEAEAADRDGHQLFGADRHARLFRHGRGRPHQGRPGHVLALRAGHRRTDGRRAHFSRYRRAGSRMEARRAVPAGGISQEAGRSGRAVPALPHHRQPGPAGYGLRGFQLLVLHRPVRRTRGKLAGALC